MTARLKFSRLIFLVLFLFFTPIASYSYSVLTHQAIIDSTWDEGIKPLLLQHYPNATEEQLREARAYVYGGAIIQDMGYYPFGSKLFTDLAHYVRSGDFVKNLLNEASNLNEYAFAVGAMAHYAADNDGHSIGINRAVPLVYPKLRAKFGSEITYADDPTSHLRTEFGFDVLQVARGHYASQSFHDFVGFKVSKEVLERAFLKTYGLELKDVFNNLDLAISTYRHTVSSIIPQMTKVAWELKKDEIQKNTPGITREQFLYNLSRANYEKEFGGQYQKPGFFAKMLACLIRILPKVGPLKTLAFKAPTPEAERLFQESFNATVKRYSALLAQVKEQRPELHNTDFDTGKPTHAGEYRLADETYAKLLIRLSKKDFEKAQPDLRQNILAFYSDLNAPIATKQDKDEWRNTLKALDKLKATPLQSSKTR